MNDSTEHTSYFTDLFREDRASRPAPDRERVAEPVRQPASPALRLPTDALAEPGAQQTYWRMLRAFFRSGEGGSEQPHLLYPALLAPFRDGNYLPHDYPCWLPDLDTLKREEKPADTYLSLHELLIRTLRQITPVEGEARILKDNLPRLESIVHRKLRGVDDTFRARPVLEEALRDLAQELAIDGMEGEAFVKDLSRLKEKLPQTGVLIPFTPHLPLHLLAALLPLTTTQRREALLREVQPLIQHLEELVAVEKANRPDAQSSEHLQETLDFADSYVKFDELASILPRGGSQPMAAERLHRLEQIIATLREASSLLFPQRATLLLDSGLAASVSFEWEKSFPDAWIESAPAGRLCDRGSDLFDEQMDRAARVFSAIRMARLEIDGHYLSAIHRDFFTHFDWRSFSEKEMSACPPVLLLASSSTLLRGELGPFSRMLASNRPVKVFLFRNDEESETYADPVFRPEPGALAIAHRNPYVLQASSLRPFYLADGFHAGLTTFAPAVFHLLMPVGGDDWNAHFLTASAAVEGRAFPGFSYDGDQGPKWGSRFDLRANPQTDTDWPAHQLTVLDEDGGSKTLPLFFTFADFAALHPSFSAHFLLVPPAYWTEDLIPVADYLQLPPEDTYAKVPYVWMADEAHTLHRAAVAWPLVRACRERLDFWHYLQENAGIHSYHVEQATEKLRREVETAASQRIAELEAAHRQELNLVKEETARTAMERLASALLELEDLTDLSTPTTAPVSPKEKDEPAAQKPTTGEVPETESLPAPEEETEELLPLGEAWIDSALCTTCNECININGRIFQYNGEKQAYVVDPKGGPFADIVKAAEKCPVGIIHPGAPQDPEEPELEALTKRAEKFN